MAAAGSGSREVMEARKKARVVMFELANMMSVPMALNAVVRLGVPDAIWQSGSNAPLTAAEILLQLRPPPPPTADPFNLQRLLRLLASHGVFAEHIPSPTAGRRYSLTEVGRTLVADDGEGGASYAPYVLRNHQEALVRAWPLLHEAVLDSAGPEPFARANGGKSAYAYFGEDTETNVLMQRAMWRVSVPFMEALLDGYTGAFDGVGTLVDVGGSSGVCLRLIMQRNPGIRVGINFDLPEVVAEAPAFPGVTHVGGDMFKSIPHGDAIFMKGILTSWTDEECTLILKNCYDALPEGGKLISCEPVVTEETDDSHMTRALLESDVFMMAIFRAQGRDRTEEAYRQFGLTAGFRQFGLTAVFPNFRTISLDHFFTVLEFRK